jgi:hypothetical protein
MYLICTLLDTISNFNILWLAVDIYNLLQCHHHKPLEKLACLLVLWITSRESVACRLPSRLSEGIEHPTVSLIVFTVYNTTRDKKIIDEIQSSRFIHYKNR